MDACTHISKVRRMSTRIKTQQFGLDVPAVICIKGLLYNVVSQDPRASQEDHQWPIPVWDGLAGILVAVVVILNWIAVLINTTIP